MAGAISRTTQPQFQTPESREALESAPASASDAASVGLQIVFDVSDLIQYCHNARLPTGIQRVQIEIITNLILTGDREYDLKLCLLHQRNPTPGSNCRSCSSITSPSWRWSAEIMRLPTGWRVLEELKLHLSPAKPLQFQRGAYLINLGTSWWLQNYFLHVRDAKARFGIRYVPYVHDCIPIITPEHCVENLTRDFITWALGAFQHADHVLVNSRATAHDVKMVAARLGHTIEDPQVVTLDADFRTATSALPQEFVSPSRSNEILMKHDLAAGSFVLFVSTVESRKNHMMAFSAWLTLAKQHGPERVPEACLRRQSWMAERRDLRQGRRQPHLATEGGLPFEDIRSRPRSALPQLPVHAVYPASYEGWGLPVTESLCYGKVPVLANASSLPEAGGEFRGIFRCALRERSIARHLAATVRPRVSGAKGAADNGEVPRAALARYRHPSG